MKTYVVFTGLILATALCFVGCSGGSRSEVKADTGQVTLEALMQEARLDKAEICVRYEPVIPDSLKDKVAKLMTDMMAGGSAHLTTSDYEDPEDLADKVGELANRLYQKKEKRVYLRFTPTGEEDYNPEYVLCEDLTPSRKKVFDYLNR